jgi:NitT/TauT family transport system substrate-binding protein
VKRAGTHSLRTLITLLIGMLSLAACSVGFEGGSSTQGSVSGLAADAGTLRLGYFANLTHATALVGVGKGFLQQKLGATRLVGTIFDSGPEEISALLGGSIDAAYAGPAPAVNGFVKSHGQGLRIIAGAATGGAELVVDKSITTIAQLKGATLATPQLGNTQDVALRYFLAGHGLGAPIDGHGAVTVEPTPNSTTLTLFAEGRLSGAWLPEPYASQLVAEGGHVLVDERSLWPGGQFTTTDLVVSASYLAAHAQIVADLLQGELATNAWIAAEPAAAEAVVNQQLAKLTGKALKPAVLARAWAETTVTDDPLAATLRAEQQHAVAVGLQAPADLAGILDLAPLNAALKAAGRPPVAADGLGAA